MSNGDWFAYILYENKPDIFTFLGKENINQSL